MSAPINPLSELDTTDTTHKNTKQDDISIDPQNENKTPEDNENISCSAQDNCNGSASTSKQNDSDDADEDKPKPKPKRCPHLNRIKKKINRFKNIQCHKCHGSGDKDDGLVYCLACFKVNCSRNSKHSHGLNHYINNTKHNLCMMLPSYDELNEYPKSVILDEMLPIWCYKCDVYLHETDQNTSPKLDRIRSEVYGCLQRGNKRISRTQKDQQNKAKYTHNSPKRGPNKNKKRNKYTPPKKDKAQHQNLEKWMQIDEDCVENMSNDKENGYIGIFGLQNLGNTCFFNSIIQNLSETRPLIRGLTACNDVIEFTARRIQMKDEKEEKSNTNNRGNKKRRNRYKTKDKSKDTKLRGRLLTEFHGLIADAHAAVASNKSRGCVVPSGLLNAVIARNRRFSGRRQQDSHELMRVLVEGMRDQNEKMLKRDRKTRLMRNVMQWTVDDVMEWCAHYEIDLGDCEAIEVSDFAQFIKTNDGLLDGIDLSDSLCTARDCLRREECAFYCAKHSIKLVEAKGDKMETIIDDVFGGVLESTVTCCECGNVSRTTEEFFDLSLSITAPQKASQNGWSKRNKRKQRRKKHYEVEDEAVETGEVRGLARLKDKCDLLDCLAAFTDCELLSGSDVYGCTHCTRKEVERIKAEGGGNIDELVVKHNANKQILIGKAPQALALHLKRFEQQGYRLSKVNKKIAFPLHLDIAPYLSDTRSTQSDKKCMYQLYGISVHHGSMSGGHYIAYTHKHRKDGPNNGWYYFSDSSYKAVNIEQVLTAQPYVLFYQKCADNLTQ